ncbi:myb-binding protein 1A-like protein [Haliotis rubra]|uniref:myb-binding protein 1A-like protein n=1 Tax=Haliotis rubra TaxID=36100 RepID=UPI001EE5655F|nr:myb-binding protein 1A-like protein [Haliotis rubra]
MTPSLCSSHMLACHSSPSPRVSLQSWRISVCYEKATQKKKVKHDDEPAWMEVVTEVLVSMMSQRSNLTRIIANTVFTALQSNLTREALGIIITALQPNKSADEEKEMLAFEDDEVMDADSVTDVTTTTDDNNEESRDDDSEEESSADEEPEVPVDEALRETVKVALGKAAVDDEDEDEEESESDLSETEMLKLDAKLAVVFRSLKKARSQKQKEKRRQILLFKSRLLDLVEIVVKGQLLASHAMDVVELLLQLMEAGHRRKEEKQLGDRAFGIFRRLAKKQKEIKSDPELEKTSAFVMIDNLIQYSRKAHSQDLVKAISDACLVIIRLLIHQKLDAPPSVKTRSKSKSDSASVDKEEADLPEVLDKVRSSLSDFLYRRDHHLHMVFFHNMLNKHPMMFWPLTDLLLQSLNDAKVKVHSKTQACSLLSALFSAGKNLPRDVGDDHWGQFSSTLSTTLHTLLLRLSVESIKPKFTLELLHVVVRLSIIHPDTARQVATNEVTEKLTGLKSHLNKDARSMCNRLLNFTRQKTGKKQKQRKKKMKNSGQQNGDVVENMAELTLINGAGGDNSSDLLSDSVTSTMSVDSDSPRKRRSSDEVDATSAGSSRKKKKPGEKTEIIRDDNE